MCARKLKLKTFTTFEHIRPETDTATS